MSLNHLENVARAAGYAAVLDDADDAAEHATLVAPRARRYLTPDAPPPRKGTSLTLFDARTALAARRLAVASAVQNGLRTVQSMLGARGAHA